MELKQYAAEHIIENGKHYPEKWVNRYFIEVADAQRALDAEREKVKRLSTCGTDHSTPWWQVKCEDLEAQLATLQAQLAAEQHRADRAVQDRRDALDVKTKEGMSCSEWLMRTATAERQVNELKAQLWQVEEALDEALGALGYPVPADTPSPGRYKCGLCEAATLLSAAGKQMEVK